MTTTLITNDPRLIELVDQFLEPDLDFTDEIYDTYYCINVKPFKCQNCGKLICYASGGPHLILIWAEKDDDEMLQLADLMMKDGNYDPRVVSYNRIIGPCIPYEKAKELGWLEWIE